MESTKKDTERTRILLPSIAAHTIKATETTDIAITDTKSPIDIETDITRVKKAVDPPNRSAITAPGSVILIGTVTKSMVKIAPGLFHPRGLPIERRTATVVMNASLAADDMIPGIERAITGIRIVKNMSLHLLGEMNENKMTDQSTVILL